MPRVAISKRALRELEEIWRYSADQWGIAKADDYVLALREACDGLGDHPHMGREIRELGFTYRRRAVGSHYILYRIRNGGVVMVARVIHQSRDLRRRLR